MMSDLDTASIQIEKKNRRVSQRVEMGGIYLTLWMVNSMTEQDIATRETGWRKQQIPWN